MGDVQGWKEVLSEHGWATCTMLDNTDPAAFMVGIPHPKYGIMRASVRVQPHITSLSALHQATCDPDFYENVQGWPILQVGKHFFVDYIGGQRCTILGILHVFDISAGCVRAPVALAKYDDMFLPYFEHDDWVYTGWGQFYNLSKDFKPCGWGCPLLTPSSGAESVGSNLIDATAHSAA